MLKPQHFLMLLLFLPFLSACNKDNIQIELPRLENDYVEAEINGETVRFDAFRFVADRSYYRKQDSNLQFTRSLANGMEDITIKINKIDLDEAVSQPAILLGRSSATGEASATEMSIELISREVGGTSHCPTLSAHHYKLSGTLYIDSWSRASGILEGRFEDIVQEQPSGSGAFQRVDEMITYDQSELKIEKGAFRVWVQVD